MGLSPLHARMMHMFSRLDDNGHTCYLDNLYNSVKFARAAYSLEVPVEVEEGETEAEPIRKRVKLQGVIREHGRGVPPEVKQKTPKGKTAQLAAKGTTKLAVLRGDPSYKDLIDGSCYDQKPF